MSLFRIVVADDHELMRKAVRALLEGESTQQVVGEAATGLETIAQVATLRPDLVILDLAMPELDGLEVAARVRQLYPKTAMILLTASLTPALERQALAIGIQRCVSKSAAPQNLTNAVRELRSDLLDRASLNLASNPEQLENGTSAPPQTPTHLSGHSPGTGQERLVASAAESTNGVREAEKALVSGDPQGGEEVDLK